ncbi:RelA-associated inhibitor [Triplophysa tibetana]|uniref:RelA-associated inhibitor n=1 Tax=Triplophysa tibetana TaxID=1572043 RepID=A0A5A9NZ00_9TELE|nr:RelA-associated inhibitor [Triplophysa tibetana]
MSYILQNLNKRIQSINDDLNASLATADELSREFSSLMQEATPAVQTTTAQSSKPPKSTNGSSSFYSANKNGNESIMSFPQSSISSPTIESNQRSLDSTMSRTESNLDKPSSMILKTASTSPLTQQKSPYMSRKDQSDTRFNNNQMTPPNMSPKTMRSLGMTSLSYGDPTALSSQSYDSKSARSMMQPSAEEGMQKPKNPSKWNETDLDVSYERKSHHAYDKNEWIRPSLPNSNWKESNLDAPPSTKKPQPSYSSLPRNTRIAVPPDHPLTPSSLYGPQPIISRISIPPTNPGVRKHRPIPLSVIMRLQNPAYALDDTRYTPDPVGGQNPGIYRQALPLPKEYFRPVQTPQPQQPQRQPAYYREVLHSADVDAELEKQEKQDTARTDESKVEEPEMPPRPLSPTRLQPVVAHEAEMVTDVEELIRIRSEFPRALKRRGSVEVSQPSKKMPVSQPNPYKQMINKLFHKRIPIKEEPIPESCGSSDEEESPKPASVPVTMIQVSRDQKNLRSILRKSKKSSKPSLRKAHLSPLVLMLDGALVGELETVQKAAQAISDPSLANDEGITALHNAICGGHFPVVEFLVRIGANVSAPDSHGWTPLHCAASCNDLRMCEFLVRNGAAVLAVTDSDGATAAQKCDPYAVNFENCESFLRGVEEVMGVENSGVVYALWVYSAQAPDELSFKEGDMVTILQKTEGVDWWWASLCGREGFVPINYFGVRRAQLPKNDQKNFFQKCDLEHYAEAQKPSADFSHKVPESCMAKLTCF